MLSISREAGSRESIMSDFLSVPFSGAMQTRLIGLGGLFHGGLYGIPLGDNVGLESRDRSEGCESLSHKGRLKDPRFKLLFQILYTVKSHSGRGCLQSGSTHDLGRISITRPWEVSAAGLVVSLSDYLVESADWTGAHNCEFRKRSQANQSTFLLQEDRSP